jgi:hypothetical protein
MSITEEYGEKREGWGKKGILEDRNDGIMGREEDTSQESGEKQKKWKNEKIKPRKHERRKTRSEIDLFFVLS